METATRQVSIPSDLYKAAEKRANASGSSINQVVAQALRSVLVTGPFPSPNEAAHQASEEQRHTQRQPSLPSLYLSDPIITLIAGLLKGEHTVSQALTHGNFGLGTLDHLDGEVVVLDGVAYHQNRQGTSVLSGDEPSPFMAVTWFDKAKAAVGELAPAEDYTAFQEQLLGKFPSKNVVYAVHVSVKLSYLKVRAVCKQPNGTPLVVAAERQLIFEVKEEVEGDLVGFWNPEYSAGGLNVPGFHLHFLSADRKQGGHVLELCMDGGTARYLEIHRCIVDLPSNEAFMHQRLSMKNLDKDLHTAEGARGE